MDIRDYKGLKAQAARTLEGSDGAAYKVVLIYSAVMTLLPFAVNLIACLLEVAMAGSDGLGAMGMLAILESIQELLALGVSLFMPFWSIGLVCISMRLTRNEPVDNTCLTTGFRIPGRVFGAYMLQSLFLSVAAIGAAYVGLLLAMPLMVGAAQDFLALVMEEPALEVDTLIRFVTEKGLLGVMIPTALVVTAAMMAVLIPLSYRVSQTWYVLLEGKSNAMGSIREGVRMTKGNRWHLFRLDLSFWWFHLAVWALSDLGGLPQLLQMVGVDLGLSALAAELIFGGISALGLLLFYRKYLPYVQTTYAYAYEAMRQQGTPALEEPRQPE